MENEFSLICAFSFSGRKAPSGRSSRPPLPHTQLPVGYRNLLGSVVYFDVKERFCDLFFF
jgi:hypothetical protein